MVIDEFSRESLDIVVERRLNHDDVLHCLTDLFVTHGLPEHIRSNNGSESTAKAVSHWLERTGVRTLYIEPGSPWEIGSCQSFNGKRRDELLDREIFYTLGEAQVLIEYAYFPTAFFVPGHLSRGGTRGKSSTAFSRRGPPAR